MDFVYTVFSQYVYKKIRRYCLCVPAKTSRGQVIKSAPVAGIEDESFTRAFDVLALASWGFGGRKQPLIILRASTCGGLTER